MRLHLLRILLNVMAPYAAWPPMRAEHTSVPDRLALRCSHCNAEARIPHDWTSWQCQACGTHGIGPAGRVFSHSREWTRAHFERHGLRVVAQTPRGEPSFIAQLAAERSAPGGGDAA